MSGLSATYWATAHLTPGAGAKFVGFSTGAANSLEATVAVLIGLRLFRVTHKVAISTAGFCALIAIATALSRQLEFIWLERIADGVIAGLATTSALGSVLTDARLEPSGAKLIVGFESIVLITFAAGSVLAAIVWPSFGRAAFLIAGALYLAALPVWRKDVADASAISGLNIEALKNPYILGILAMSASASMWVSQIAFVLTGPRSAGQVFPGSMEKGVVSILVVVYLAILAVGLGIWSQVLLRIKPPIAAVLSAMGAVIAAIVLLVSNLSQVSDQLRHVDLGIYVAALLVQAGLVPSILSAVNNSTAAKKPLTVASVFVVATACGSILGPLLGGPVVAAYSFSGMCMVSAVLALITLVAVLMDIRKSVAADKATFGL